ncbi:MAG: hypothetical protein WBW94_16825 [Anaerolineales bacterium]
MNKKLWMIVGGVLTVAVVIASIGAIAVYAQSPTPATPGRHGWLGFGSGTQQLSQDELSAAAQTLGITASDLSSQLAGGKTLAQIATAQNVNLQLVMQALQAARTKMLPTSELNAAATALGISSADLSADFKNGQSLWDVAQQKGVSIQTVLAAIQAARTADFRNQINQAVTNGKMTQDKANWLLEGLDKGYIGGSGGFGFGFGGFGGPHNFPGGWQGRPTPQTTP